MYGFQRDFVRKFHISHFWVNECVLSPAKEMPMWNGVEEATSMKLNAMRISRVYNDDGNVKIIFSIFSISFSRDLFTFLGAYICTHFERKSVRRSLHRFDAKKKFASEQFKWRSVKRIHDVFEVISFRVNGITIWICSLRPENVSNMNMNMDIHAYNCIIWVSYHSTRSASLIH